MKAFISHISEEAAVAIGLKAALDHDFLGFLKFFVSSDGESIGAGDDWLKSVDDALRNSSLLITLCSPESVRRPWINFEVGAAWMLDIPIIPVCHAGLTPNDLPIPLSLRQGVMLDKGGLRRLYKQIAAVLSCRAPVRAFDELANELSLIETQPVAGDSIVLSQLASDRGIGKRLREALEHPKHKWRTLEWAASDAGVSEEVAANLLRANAQVRFSKGKSGEIIVGLISRVGQKR